VWKREKHETGGKKRKKGKAPARGKGVALQGREMKKKTSDDSIKARQKVKGTRGGGGEDAPGQSEGGILMKRPKRAGALRAWLEKGDLKRTRQTEKS